MPWDEWEDYAAGFYDPGVPTAVHARDSRDLLCDPNQFHAVAHEMLRHWANSAVHNIQHMETGRNAWIGQASCLYAHGAPPSATRQAWGEMTPGQQETANAVAARVRQEWEEAQRGSQTLFN